MEERIKVLVVDDSRIFRNFIAQAVSEDKIIKVIGSVFNGKKALEFIKDKEWPDVVTLDVEMPEMDGIETLKEINKLNASNKDKRPIGVIMVSNLTKRGADITMESLNEGAFDFITKPSFDNPDKNIENLKSQLCSKIKVYYYRKDRDKLRNMHQTEKEKPAVRVPLQSKAIKPEAIVIASSTGGPKALALLLPELSEMISLPVLIVQHMPPFYTASLANNLNSKCANYTVIEGANGAQVKSRHIYIAPGGKHLVLKRNLQGEIITEISDAPPENNCKPSADVLFRSASVVYSGNCIAVVLTGMGNDGTNGVKTLRRKGSYIIIQDEASSIVWGMPGSVFETGLHNEMVSLDKIAKTIANKLL